MKRKPIKRPGHGRRQRETRRQARKRHEAYAAAALERVRRKFGGRLELLERDTEGGEQ